MLTGGNPPPEPHRAAASLETAGPAHGAAVEPAARLTVAEPAPARSRRELARTFGVSMGGAVVGALAVAQGAAAQGGSVPAYQDAPNTFTQNQVVLANLGIGVAPLAPVHVQTSSPGAATQISANTMALLARHTQDWGGQTYDLIDMFHKSCGDAIFVAHQGGVPPGYTGSEPGGIGGLNILIPYYLDDTATGRAGRVVNTKTQMRAIKLQNQPTSDRAPTVDIAHWGNAYAAVFSIQPSANGEPTGTGGGILMNDFSPSSSIKVGKWTAPGPAEAIVSLNGRTSAPIPALRITSGSTVGALFKTDGSTALGTGNPFAVQLQVEQPSTGISRNLALSNGSGVQGSGTQIEFDDGGAQYALIASTYDSVVAPRNSSLRFSVRSQGGMTERMRLDASGMGFFGAPTVAKPAITGSKGGAPALRSLISALVALGLMSDSSAA